MTTPTPILPRLALALAAVTLGACGGNACERPEPYQTATERGALRVPEDLSTPPTSGKYEVPEASADKPVRGPCGDAPPLRKVEATARPPAPARGAALTAPPPSLEAPADAALEREVRDVVTSWLTAWREADAEGYLAHYAASFEPPVAGETLSVWQRQRRELLAATGPSDLRYDRLRVTGSAETPVARFIQEFHSEGQINAVVKELDLIREDGRLKIVRERVAEVL